MLAGELDIDKLKAELPCDMWDRWERFYSEEPWGELRSDLRALTTVLHMWNPHTEASMQWPYFEQDDVDDAERYEKLQAELAAIGPDKIQEAFKRGREKFLAEKAKRG